MAINVSTLVPASEKAKNVATEDYVDTQINSIDVSADINDNNDLFAQKLGYGSYSELAAAATAGTTLINGGYINTNLINANGIKANQIDTTGLVAENISSDLIAGKTITGSTIEGARINGAVIKASYLDLDGDLEVLTNYHISTAMYNSNPSNYSDAIYIEADGEYRIPSISSISSYSKSTSTSGTHYLYSGIYSYEIANAGSNNKAVKSVPSEIVLGSADDDSQLCDMYITGTESYSLYIGSTLLIKATFVRTGTYKVKCTVSGAVGSSTFSVSGGSTSRTYSYKGASFVVYITADNGAFNSIIAGGSVSLASNTETLKNMTFTGGQIYAKMQSVGEGSISWAVDGAIVPAVYINNML